MFLDFFDEVYVVNLKHRIDRKVRISDELNSHGIPFTIYEAIRDENGIRGLVDTMKKLLQEIYDKKQSNVIILEDDASFLVSNPVAMLKQVIPQIPKTYHLLYLGLNMIARPIRMSENILKVTDCYSTHAIAYSRAGIEAVLNRINDVPLSPYDQFMRSEIVPQFQSYCTFPMMATQCVGHSDIEHKEMDWGKLMTMTYQMHTKNLPYMAQEIAQCVGAHKINGVEPAVNSDQFDVVQNPDLVGRDCDCGRFFYTEGRCQTCGGEKWKIIWEEKK